MGRSRTMNETRFTIYKSQIGAEAETEAPLDIKRHPLTRQLYVRNCDQKMAGNLSSIYQTLISLLNLANRQSAESETARSCWLKTDLKNLKTDFRPAG